MAQELDNVLDIVLIQKILALAAEAKADFIVSGDQHLLLLRKFQNIPILTAKKFLLKYR